uniref:Uncharacterized protein n=1 Tax=Glossina pallidipes TaxID=7398 RepID=A0A1B0ACZ2_GLOPL
MPTLEDETAASASAGQSESKSASGSPKLNGNDSSSINSLQDTRYLNGTTGAANININPSEIPTRRALTAVVQAISSLTTDQDQKLEKENQIATVEIIANDCSNNGQSVMVTTTTASTSLASFNGNSNIDNNGNPNSTASNYNFYTWPL